MDVDSLLVHAVEAKSEIDELLVEGIDDSFGPDRIAFRCSLELRSFGGTVSLEELEPVCGIPVGVDIDGARVLRRVRVTVSIGSTLGHVLVLRWGGSNSIGRCRRGACVSDATDPKRSAQIRHSDALRARPGAPVLPIPDSYGSNCPAALVRHSNRGL